MRFNDNSIEAAGCRNQTEVVATGFDEVLSTNFSPKPTEKSGVNLLEQSCEDIISDIMCVFETEENRSVVEEIAVDADESPPKLQFFEENFPKLSAYLASRDMGGKPPETKIGREAASFEEVMSALDNLYNTSVLPESSLSIPVKTENIVDITVENCSPVKHSRTSEILMETVETAMAVAEIAVNGVNTAVEFGSKIVAKSAELRDNFLNSKFYNKIVNICMDIEEYFRVANINFSESVDFTENLLHSNTIIYGEVDSQNLKKIKSLLHLKVKKDICFNRLNFVAHKKTADFTEEIQGTVATALKKKNTLKAFIIALVQNFTARAGVTYEDLKNLGTAFVRDITNIATHTGALICLGGVAAEKNGLNFAREKAGILKNALVTKFDEKRSAVSKNLENKKLALREIDKTIRVNSKKDKKAYLGGLLKGTKDFFGVFGDYFSSFFNHIAPAVSVLVLTLLVVNFAGSDLGILTSGVDSDTGSTRISLFADDSELQEFDSRSAEIPEEMQFSLKFVNDATEFTNSEVAETLPSAEISSLSIGNSEVADEVFQVMVGGEVVGVVADKLPIMNALAERLAMYNTGNVKNLAFGKEIEYLPVKNVNITVNDTEAVISKLLGYEEIDSIYMVEKGDTSFVLTKKLNVTVEALEEDNVGIDLDNLVEGTKIVYTAKKYFMPVTYSKILSSVKFEEYSTMTVDTDTLYKGNTAVLTQGQRGEISETYDVLYTDGVETGKNLVYSEVIQRTITEIIGNGTFVATPSRKLAPSYQLAENGKYIWPVNGGYISASIGDGRGHQGLDIAAPKGTEIYAVDEGVVVRADWYSGYGNCVIVEHPDGYKTLYGHMSEIIAYVGMTVQTGDVIGLVGSTGYSTGNHLHFEVHYDGQKLDGLDYISR